MNDFLKEKENLLNSIENNTSEHWKEYYKDVPLNCIFDDLVIDINEIKRLTEENQQLKEQLQQKEEEIKELCKKIKVNEKSRRKMQKSLMEKIQEIEKARKEAITYIKNNLGRKCYFNKEENRYKTNESKVLEILDIEKSDK